MSEAHFRVLGHRSNSFLVDIDGATVEVKARGRLKRDGEILVGDYVSLDESDGERVIASVKKRMNSLIRPAVANVDAVVLVVAPVPAIDWFLVDKMVINCKRAGIACILCLNKTDIDAGLFDELKRQYAADVSAIIAASAKDRRIDELINALKGKFVCFAGQSAVGKSTLSNAVLGCDVTETGELSERIGRGKNTTTSASVFKSPSGFYFIDTPGFSMLDVFEDDYMSLAAYYDEFVELADECKFHPCTHTGEPDCAVKRAVEEGKINRARYERYLKIFNESKNAYKRRRTK